MAKHKHGSMSVTDHDKTFEGFIRFSTWVVVAAIVVLIFMALVNS